MKKRLFKFIVLLPGILALYLLIGILFIFLGAYFYPGADINSHSIGGATAIMGFFIIPTMIISIFLSKVDVQIPIAALIIVLAASIYFYRKIK